MKEETEMNEEIEVLKTIDTYLRGELSVSDADQLWSKLLQRQEYMDYLVLEVTLRSASFGSGPSGSTGSDRSSEQVR